jgi:hypothetical protein
MNIVSVCVGVSDYPTDWLVADEDPLFFAHNSARTISGAIGRKASLLRKHLLVEDKNSYQQFMEALRAEAADVSVDLLLCSFTGHGRRGALLMVHKGSVVEVSAHDLAAHIQIRSNKKIIFFLDCCFSGLLAKELHELAPDVTVISSTSADHRAWEDETLHLSCFAAALEKAFLEIDQFRGAETIKEVFSAIEKSTAHFAYGLKRGARQSPKILSADVTGNMPYNTPGVLVKRVRQILISLVVTFALTGIILYCMTYHLAVDQYDTIVVKRGHAVFSFLPNHPLSTITTTLFPLRMIESLDEKQKYTHKKYSGWLTSKGVYGLPVWYETILNGTGTAMKKKALIYNAGGKLWEDEEERQRTHPLLVSEVLLVMGEDFLDSAEIRNFFDRLGPFREVTSCTDPINNVYFDELEQQSFQDSMLTSLLGVAHSSSYFDEKFLVGFMTLCGSSNRDIDYSSSFADRIFPSKICRPDNWLKILRAVARRDKWLGSNHIDDYSEGLLQWQQKTNRQMLTESDDYYQDTFVGCLSQVDTALAVWGNVEGNKVESSLWNRFAERQELAAERREKGTPISFEEDSEVELDYVRVQPGIDPLVGLLGLASHGNLGSAASISGELLHKKKKKLIDFGFEDDFGFAEDGIFRDNENYGRLHYTVDNLMRAGKAPEELWDALWMVLRTRTFDVTKDNDVEQKLILLKMMARQAPYLTDREFNVLKDYLLSFETEVSGYTPPGNFSTNTDLSFAPFDRRSSIQAVWALMSLGGSIPQQQLDQLRDTGRSIVEWRASPGVTSFRFRGEFHTVGAALVNLSRTGILHPLEAEHEDLVLNYALDISAREIVPPKEYRNDSGTFILQYDDCFVQKNMLYASVGVSRYGREGMEEFFDSFTKKLQASVKDSRKLRGEMNIAAAWITLQPEEQWHEYYATISKLRDKQSSIILRDALATILVLMRTSIDDYPEITCALQKGKGG